MSELLDLVLQAAGGIEKWRQVKSLEARVSVTGGLFGIKGHPESVIDCSVRIDPNHPTVIFSPFIRGDYRGYFTPGRVWIEDRSGQIVDERKNPRESFAGQALETPWDQLHLLYFIGYAIWNNFTIPFLFTRSGFEVNELKEPHLENGEVWRRLQVKFPSDIPTHNNFQPGGEQTFFFNGQGLLQRVDYEAAAPASHYYYDHANFGIVYPTLQRVVGRTDSGSLVNGPTYVLLQIADVLVIKV